MASGDVAPKRIIRNAPEGTPTTGFTNAASAAYDPKREEVLVPNCVSVPRISDVRAYASGNVAPDRTIEGQQTHLSRTMHGLAFDAVHDEIIVPVALSGAVLVFKGDARGDELPVRIIQGSHTGLIRPQTVEVDPVNGEIVAADSSSRAILVFDRLANGDVAPKRKIGGSKTDFRDIVGVAVDPVANVIIAANRSAGGPNGLYMFDRLADGDVAPIRHIGGINSGVLGRFRQLKVDSERGNDLRRGAGVPPPAGDAAEGSGPLHQREGAGRPSRAGAQGARRTTTSWTRKGAATRPASSARGPSPTTATCRRG